MTAILERRESTNLWARFCEWITSTENRIYIGWFGVLMVPTLLTAASVFIIAFIAAPPVDIDGIREPVSGSLLYGNNISAPRSFLFRTEKVISFIYTYTTSILDGGVTYTPEMVSINYSMILKLYAMTVASSLVESELSFPRLKLHCLNPRLRVLSVPKKRSAIYTFNKMLFGSMMCPNKYVIFYSAQKWVKQSKGESKGIESSESIHSGGIKRRERTMGSTPNTADISGSDKNRVDGEIIVPFRGPLYHKVIKSIDLSLDKGTEKGRVSEDHIKDGKERTSRIGRDPLDNNPLIDLTFRERLNLNRLKRKVSIKVNKKRISRVGKVLQDDNPLLDLTFQQRLDEHTLNRLKKAWIIKEKSYSGVLLPQGLNKLNELCMRNKEGKIHDIFDIFKDPAVFDLAYDAIKSNPGNMTPGIDGSTLTGWSRDSITNIQTKLFNGKFKFSPARVTEIPKPDGSLRKLQIAPPKDKVVQRIITNILEIIYEPTFSDQSFGFRKNLGCHNALEFIKKQFKPINWFIEGDISKCFDSIDHELLLSILNRRIKDLRFLGLIRLALKAGCLNLKQEFQDSIIGTPQGSIISPILCNIFMNEFDSYISNQLKPKYERGLKRAQPKVYKVLMARSSYYFKMYKKNNDREYLIKGLNTRKEAQSLPSTLLNDPDYRRLIYCRYADDFIIGIAGTYKETLEIKELCKEFLASIKLNLNDDKTFVVKASVGIRFLGFRIHVPVNQQKFRKKGKANENPRRASLGVRINAPLLYIFKKLYNKNICTLKGIPTPRMALYASSRDEIVNTYVRILKGFINFYSPSDNFNRFLYSIWYILRNSCCKVLAKFKLKTVRQVLLKFGKRLERNSTSSFPKIGGSESKKLRGELFKFGSPVDRIFSLNQRSRLTINSGKLICSICDSTLRVEMHHIRALNKLNKKLNVFEQLLVARQRKQIPLCRVCHLNKHAALRDIRKGMDIHNF